MINLLFGIPELDRMLDLKRGPFYQKPNDDLDRLASLVLLGPDGTGKSVFALHLVSRYYADSNHSDPAEPAASKGSVRIPPKVLYISTDLRFEKADKMWNNFALGRPYERDIPCERASDRRERKQKQPVADFNLERLQPAGDAVARFLDPEQRNLIGFLDLASSSAGDDWGYMIRALSLLSETPGHLVVIDSVAGFETLTGVTDAYGEMSTRRARIASVMRAAQSRCHIVFVVEESQDGSHLPEEFVADTVIRLRRRTVGGSTQRTLEIEKARGRAHAGGEHPYAILDGLGSSTGVWENPDEPRSNSDKDSRSNNYVQIYYSLQYRTQRIKARPGRGTLAPPNKVASFGIPHLDDMLAEEEAEKGLRCGKTCSLIGDAGTGKSALAYSFLCEAFREYAQALGPLTDAIESHRFNDDAVKQVVRKIANWLAPKDDVSPDLRGIGTAGDLINFVKDHDNKAWRIVGEERMSQQTWLGSRGPDDVGPGDPPLRRVQYPWAWLRHDPTTSLQVADWLLRHPACASPAVLIATGDVKADDLAARFMRWLGPIGKSSSVDAKAYQRTLFDYVAQHLICRRLETHDATAPVLFHVIEWCILEAQRLLFGPVLPNRVELRCKESWRIRLVIDNLRIIRDMYPAVRKDPLFLPLLTFYLGREGVTNLIVDTDSGRPDRDPSDEINRELRSLVTHQLYTWQVPFFGQRRIAIVAVPSVSPQHKGIIREVKLGEGVLGNTKERPVVDPHFELYSGLEEGRPQAIPLEVRLFVETPAFEEYMQRENQFFQRVFPVRHSETTSEIVIGTATYDYGALRDFCHLPTDLGLNHSLVFQVDGFWSLRREGSLANQHRYLTAETWTKEKGPVSMEDPFQLFQPIFHPDGAGFVSQRINYFRNEYYCRRVCLPKNEGSAQEEEKRKVDRVPFTWDFGFLLCKVDPWRLAANKPLKSMIGSHLAKLSKEIEGAPSPGLTERGKELERVMTVNRVWNELPKANDKGEASADDKTTLDNPESSKPPEWPTWAKEQPRFDSWRSFLEAARVVSDTAADRLGHPVPPFDFAAMTGDSVASLVLEIWFSEIYSRREQDQVRILNEVSSGEYVEPENLSLIDLLSEGKGTSIYATYSDFINEWKNWEKGAGESQQPDLRAKLKGFSLELYMTWLLLIEVLDFTTFDHASDPFDFRPDRAPVQEAVAARHWYKSACVAARNGEETGHPSELTVAVRLPGHFSVRGDWFLAAAKGSRSLRLASRAIDVLSSRRANIIRLQAGLGLPTRDIVDGNLVGQLRTGLRGPNVDGIIDNVTYESMYQTLAAKHYKDDKLQDKPVSEKFYWLWRSGMRDYDRHSRPWRRWLKRIFLWTPHYHRQHSTGWIGGFKPYDELCMKDYSQVITFESFAQFAKMCDLLIAELRAATPIGPRGDD